jgi:hypothetical protein
MRVGSETHQTHTFSCVFGERFRGSTLCLQPSERTQLFIGIGSIIRNVKRNQIRFPNSKSQSNPSDVFPRQATI